MIMKVLVSAVFAVGVGVVVAAPAIADPLQCSIQNVASFCDISQMAPPKAGPAAPDQITAGIQQGLSDLHANAGQH
jgi:hypothetical protein